MHLSKTGDWGLVGRAIGAMSSEAKKAQQLSLKRFGLKWEATAKSHLTAQDLRHKPLNPKYVAQKLKKGFSDKILIASGTYFQSISSFVEGDTVFAGVKRDATDKNGVPIADIAAVHEFGSRDGKIPARPLWQPSYKETLAWHVKENSATRIFYASMKSKFGL